MRAQKKVSKRFWIVLIGIIILAGLVVLGCLLFSWLKARQEQEQWAQLVQQYTADKLTAYAAENEQYEDYEMDVAFLGDSLTDGYPLEQFYPQFKVTNRGIGGDTTFNLQNRLQISVLDLKPKVIVMLIGANNLNTMFDNYEQILKTFQQQLPETKVVLLSLTSMSGDWAHKNEIAAYNNVKIRLFAQEYGYEFVDLYTPLFDLQTGMMKAEYTTDGGHLTMAGYEVLTAAITPVLEDILGYKNSAQ